jgi:hypothetical protein
MDRGVTKLVFHYSFLDLELQETKERFKQFNAEFMEAFKEEINEAFTHKVAARERARKDAEEASLRAFSSSEDAGGVRCTDIQLSESDDAGAPTREGSAERGSGGAGPERGSDGAVPELEIETDGPPEPRSGDFWKKMKTVYKRLTLRCHPDKPGGSAELFRRISKWWKKGAALRLLSQAHAMGIELDFLVLTVDDMATLEADIQRVEAHIANTKSTLAFKWGTSTELERVLLRRQFAQNILARGS